jgi:two-component system, LytTR family, response regulator
MRALIVDDEPLARANIRILLARHPEIEIAGESGSGAEAIEQIRTTQPDLIFLDVQMPECDGFDILEMLGSQATPAVIFVTAYDEYALRAFEAGALDYLLKPFTDDRFDRAVSRAKEKLQQQRKPERVTVKQGNQVLFVRPEDIDWIEAADYYACLHVGTKSHLVRRSLADLEQDLDPTLFRRSHRSAIVNVRRLRALQLNRNGEYEALLENGASVPVSRRYRRQLETASGT